MTIFGIVLLDLSDNTSVSENFIVFFIVACSNVAVIQTDLFAWGISLPLRMKKWHGQAPKALLSEM